MNRLDGDAVGPVKVLVSNPFYSHDHQHVIIPEGTVVLGEAKKIGAAGFGQQRRMAVVFHRLIMPDGYSVDLDQFHGLDQIGEEGLKDKVNNHYLEIFGTSIALGVIAGAGEITQGGGTITASGSQAFTNGTAGQRLAVRDHHPGPLHADTAHHHHSRGPPREGLFHAGHASACVYPTTPFPRRFKEASMRIIALSFLLLSALALAGCESKADKVKRCRMSTTPNIRHMRKHVSTKTPPEPHRLLTGERLTAEQTAALEAKRKDREVRCKPEADRLAEIQREILAAAAVTPYRGKRNEQPQTINH